MTLIETIFSGPITTVVAVVIAIALLAIAYFFGLPMFDELKKLRAENADLKKQIDDTQESEVSKLLSQNMKFSSDLQALTTELRNNPEKVMERIVHAIEKLDDELGKKDHQHGAVFEEVRQTLKSIVEHSNNSKSRDDGLTNLMHEVIRHLHNISDKQSQIIGALLGMSRIQDRNRSL